MFTHQGHFANGLSCVMKPTATLDRMMRALLAAITGMIAGAVIGVLLMTFAGAIGKSGTTGATPGVIDPLAQQLGAMTGAFLGGMLAPAACLRYLQWTAPSRTWLLLPAVTLAAGLLGASIAFPLGIFGAIAAFWICAMRIGSRPPTPIMFDPRTLDTANRPWWSEEPGS
jgi:hypothetical protein